MSAIDEIAALREQLAELQARIDALSAGHLAELGQAATAHVVDRADPVTDGGVEPDPTVGSPMSRRRWVKAAAAAAVGGTAVALSSVRPAAAADGNTLIIGNRAGAGAPQTANSVTQLNLTGSAPNGLVVQAGSSFDGESTGNPAALAGWTNRAANAIGVYGFSASSAGSGAIGVLGRVGVNGGAGVVGRSDGSSGDAIRAEGSVGGVGLSATGRTAVAATANRYGLETSGGRAAIRLVPSADTPPSARADAHVAGEIDTSTPADGQADIWACVVPGAPGTWRRLAGPGTAGAFVAIAPVRVYDSRSPAPSPGRLASGSNRVVSVADARDTGNGTVVTPNAIPSGATAVAYNITLDGTVDSGFLSVNPGDVASSPASSINWSSSNLILANAGVVKLDGSRQIKVFCGGGGRTHFLIDITGYYL